MNTSMILTCARDIAVRFPPLTVAQCVFAAERADGDFALACDLARDALDAAELHREYERDCDRSFDSGRERFGSD